MISFFGGSSRGSARSRVLTCWIGRENLGPNWGHHELTAPKHQASDLASTVYFADILTAPQETMRRSFVRFFAPVLILVCALSSAPGRQQQPSVHPAEKHEATASRETSPELLRFAVIGDTGTGDRFQLAVAKQMVAEYERDPYPMVLMLGDNCYGGKFLGREKLVFETPYAKLIDDGVKFFATLGNHDQKSAADQLAYKPFHMGGQRTYSVAPAGDLVEFFTFDSTLVVEQNDTAQLEWLDRALGASKANWKIVFIHHPPYSPGKRHGDNPILEQRLCPILEKHGVRVVMTGHEHFFAKMRENKGVDYIISGSGGKIHNGGILPDERMEAGNDKVHQFLSVTLTPDTFEFSVIAETGDVIYRGSIPRLPKGARTPAPEKSRTASP